MTSFRAISHKIQQGQRLTENDALFLLTDADLLDLGQLAADVNQEKNSDEVFYNVNRHINPTNICAMSCKFCAYSKKPGDEGAYAYSIEDILLKAGEVVKQGATEVHMVGGLHPRWGLGKYLEIVSALKTSYPQLHVKAFTAVELDWMSRRERKSIEHVLGALRDAGLGSLPGGGAEIFHPEIRDQICDTKTDAARWLEIHRTAHQMGLRSNCTMLYGHIEKPWHRIDHMRRLRELQDETNGFNVFIPLAFQPQDNDMGIKGYTKGLDDLRTLAVARLYLDNFKNIKAYWIMLGQDIAQIALHFGANDLDGTVTEEKISRAAGGRAGIIMSRREIEGLIKRSHKIPVERDTLYHRLNRSETPADNLDDTESTPLQPQGSATDNNIDSLLYRLENSRDIERDVAQQLVEKANLFALAHLATTRKSKVSRGQAALALSLSLTDPEVFADDRLLLNDVITRLQRHHIEPDSGRVSLRLDLGHPSFTMEMPRLETICRSVKTIKYKFPELSCLLGGIKAIWQLAKIEGTTIDDCLEELANAGVDIIESSHFESEHDLTNSEVIAIHRSCHHKDLRTIAKAQLDAPLSGQQCAFWPSFLQRLFAFRHLQQETRGLHAVAIEPVANSNVTPLEYLRAVAMARVVLDQVDHIVAPFSKIPSMRQIQETAATIEHPALKLAPLCLHFGATDLGTIDLDHWDLAVITQELQQSGLKTNLRHSHFELVAELT